MCIDKQRETFRNGTKGKFKDYINEPFCPNKCELFKAAVEQGYSDAKRTFTNISDFWNGENTRDAFYEHIAEKLQNLFTPGVEGFDGWHEETCDALCDWFRKKGYDGVSYGKAQKIINMAFKYLYCLDGAEKYDAVFKKCHMPLDSFTLEWYKRYVYKDNSDMIKLTNEDKWSKLTKKQYKGIIEKVQAALESAPQFHWQKKEITLPNYQLGAELFIWPEMQVHMSCESFLFAFDNMSISEKNECKKKCAAKKLEIIKEKIDTYLNNN